MRVPCVVECAAWTSAFEAASASEARAQQCSHSYRKAALARHCKLALKQGHESLKQDHQSAPSPQGTKKVRRRPNNALARAESSQHMVQSPPV
mmetsp:Transcript_73360/g.119066  ORF Transcript_73360/g.119066 Transcript_73360/m.119066 type:complete len:93 (+) Transcript_73360:219-497(+)